MAVYFHLVQYQSLLPYSSGCGVCVESLRECDKCVKIFQFVQHHCYLIAQVLGSAKAPERGAIDAWFHNWKGWGSGWNPRGANGMVWISVGHAQIFTLLASWKLPNPPELTASPPWIDSIWMHHLVQVRWGEYGLTPSHSFSSSLFFHLTITLT